MVNTCNIEFHIYPGPAFLAISSVFENVAFFGDLLIRIHDMVTQVTVIALSCIVVCISSRFTNGMVTGMRY